MSTIAIDRLIPGIHGTQATLQFFNIHRHRWTDLGEVRRDGQILGRSTFSDWDATPENLAKEHLRIGYEGDELYVEPLSTLNGAYLKLRPHQPVELAPHARFCIGRHILEFRPDGSPEAIAPLRSEDGEVFHSRVLTPLGFIDLIGPDGLPYLSFPLTKRDAQGTRIGREGPDCDLALAGDEWISSRHAAVRYSDGKCRLEDLESTNGTFLMISEPTRLRRGSLQAPDAGDVVLIGGYLIRVIEERA